MLLSSTLLVISGICGNLLAQQPISGCEKEAGITTSGSIPGDMEQDKVAEIAHCLVSAQDNFRASQWYASIADERDCKPEYIFEYAQCLKSLELYGKAKFYFQKYSQHDPIVGYQMMQTCDIARMVINDPGIFDVVRLSSNTPSTDIAPFITGEKLQFCSIESNKPVHRSVSLEDAVDGIFKVNSGVSPGVHVRVADSGTGLVYSDMTFESGQRIVNGDSGGKIFYSEKDGNGEWGGATEIQFEGNPVVAFPTLSPDGRTLYFSSDMAGGYGGMDLYASTRIGANWSEPVNLGSNVNTTGNEISPFVTDSEVYFSSDMHTGLGGFDVFRTAIMADYSGDIIPVGYPVNSSKDDIDFIWDSNNNTCYFSSNRPGGAGSYDIYRAVPQFSEKVITVRDKESMEPVADAMLVIKPGISRAMYTNMYGEATLRHNFTNANEITVQKDGFKEATIKSVSESPGKLEVYLEPAAARIVEAKPFPAPKINEEKVEKREKEEKVAKAEKEEKKEKTEKEDEEVVRAREILNVAPPAPVKATKAAKENKYFIQIAALGQNSDLTQYSNLRMYGDLVVHEDDKYSRVRVGTFDTDDEARTVLARVKSGGYPDAFVVMHAVDQGAKTSVGTPEYKVRLATYSQTANFDPTPIEHLGTIESYRKDDFTIMLLSGFSSLEEAKKAKAQVAMYGYKDAYVVMANDGALEKVKE